jgi:putative peptide zinc metalloprotease protein
VEAVLAYILCPTCKFKTLSEYVLCKHCGNPLHGAPPIPRLLALTFQSGPEPPLLESNLLSPFVMTPGVTSIGRMTDNSVILSDAQVSRHHAVIQRDETGRYLVEDLQSTNGTFLNGTRLRTPSTIKAGDLLKIGDTELLLEEAPRPVLNQSGMPLRPEATFISLSKPPLTAAGSLESITNTLWSGHVHSEHYCPRACESWALKHLNDEDGGDYFVLKGLDHPDYIRLAERDVFIWKLMDGRHSLRDILVAYFQVYHAMGTDRLIDLLNELSGKGFLQNTELIRPTQPRGAIAISLSIARRVVGAFFHKQFPVEGADEWITRIYTRFAWHLYTRSGQLALAAIALAGLAAFVIILLRGGQSLFVVKGSAILGLVVLALASTISIFLHETAHALTVKAYNRQVRRVGFMIYFGMPVFFVDTSDIWMEPKRPRIQTSLAGPFASFLVGSATSLAMLVSPTPLISDLLFKLAAWSYIDSFFNLNPLLELDGYFILMDWLDMPLLRKRSLEFVQHRLWGKLRRREAFSRDEKLFSTFGILSALWSGVAVGIFFFYEGPRMLGFFRGDPAIVASIITVVLLLALLGLIGLRLRRSKQKNR